MKCFNINKDTKRSPVIADVGLNKIPIKNIIGLIIINSEKIRRNEEYINKLGNISFCPQTEFMKIVIGLKIIKLKIISDFDRLFFLRK